MTLCPNGHPSASTDYCDVCGTPMVASAPAPAAPVAATSSAPSGSSEPITCPNCSFANLPDALFCENCGYDFTTGSLPEPDPDALGMAAPLAAPAPVPNAPVIVPVIAPVSSLDIEEGDLGQHEAAGDPGYVEAPAIEGQPTVEPAGAAAAAELEAELETATGPVASSRSASPIEGDAAWVAEVWIDPEWYAAQKSDDPLPSGGLPEIVVLTQSSLLVGRTSVSRDIHPQIDCGTDSGVSRRHCQLNTDGQRWWVEDLQSSNGTFVGAAGDELPSDAIQPGQRREVHDGDRIFVGAWTRLVIRKALPGEA
ncbi:FHA domain-containing protein [Agreia sp.]|uniref:FHA domain-containing protein n=1 Tax=Agreia sp. TaxID=1872416 RepID=UPI0035BC022B